ncbi:MAG: hypothetical protein OIF50_05895 [Flavobacteriaceae bacterium]|nr:hypothetical protein [Flavobacteriaceae bacterium]
MSAKKTILRLLFKSCGILTFVYIHTASAFANPYIGPMAPIALKQFQQIQLESFSQIPQNIGFCRCKYAIDRNSLQLQLYVFVAGNKGVMIINKQKVFFELVHPNTRTDNSVYEIWSSDQYELIIQTKYQPDSHQKQAGNIRIRAKTGASLTQKVISNCS